MKKHETTKMYRIYIQHLQTSNARIWQEQTKRTCDVSLLVRRLGKSLETIRSAGLLMRFFREHLVDISGLMMLHGPSFYFVCYRNDLTHLQKSRSMSFQTNPVDFLDEQRISRTFSDSQRVEFCSSVEVV